MLKPLSVGYDISSLPIHDTSGQCPKKKQNEVVMLCYKSVIFHFPLVKASFKAP